MRRMKPDAPGGSPWTLGLLALLLTAGRAESQTLDLRLRDAAGGPVAGAIVRLIRDSAPVAQGLTDPAGRIRLRAPAPGSYRIRIDRIGFAGVNAGIVALALGDTYRTELRPEWTPAVLPELVASRESACAREGRGGPLATALWEEIQKALTGNLLTLRARAVPLHVTTFDRELTTSGRVLRDRATASDLVRGQPYGALSPATLAERGFVFSENDSVTYASPDAELLLSDAFVASHCFRATEGDDALVGLRFEPIPGRRVPDISGVIWVHRSTGELRVLEYVYTGIDQALQRARLGGWVRFLRLPTGAWIVDEWSVRLPVLRPTILRRGVTLTGLRESGGRAALAIDGQGRLTRAILTGRVYDSTAGTGLSGAIVRLEGQHDSMVTDAAGRFQLVVGVDGPQRVIARHPKLGLIADSSTKGVTLSMGQRTQVMFSVPPVVAFARNLCRRVSNRSGLVGLAWREDGEPAEGFTVRVTYRFGARILREETDVRPGGLFGLCDLRPGIDLPIRLHNGPEALVEETVRLVRNEFRWLELRAAMPALSRDQ